MLRFGWCVGNLSNIRRLRKIFNIHGAPHQRPTLHLVRDQTPCVPLRRLEMLCSPSVPYDADLILFVKINMSVFHLGPGRGRIRQIDLVAASTVVECTKKDLHLLWCRTSEESDGGRQ